MTDTHAGSVIQHPSFVDAYIRHGWSLVPIPHGTKGPQHQGWNIKENALSSSAALPAHWGVGLAHAYSGTMAVDIDNTERAAAELKKHGIDLDQLYNAPDAVVIHSGRAGHGKLLYAMPFGLTLQSKKLIDTDPNGVKYNYLDLRCATANGLTVQDVLPPSIHPQTMQPYRWGGHGNWQNLPVIPTALLAFWQSLIDADEVRNIKTNDPMPSSWSEIREALDWIDPSSSREEWVNVGMALHYAGHQTGQLETGLTIWDEWSSRSAQKYRGQKEILTQWASFRPDKAVAVKLGTLFLYAKRNGWQRVFDAAALFKAVEVTKGPQETILLTRPQPPDINLDLFPPILTQRAREVSDTIGCDPLVPLMAGLGAVCAAVDARTRLQLVPGYKVPPVLWLMTVGEPADKKTPGAGPMLAPLDQIEIEHRDEYERSKLAWEGQEAQHATAKNAFLKAAASPDHLLAGGELPQVPTLAPQPIPVRLYIQDATSQKVVRLAADRPRGMLCHLDEMASWVKKLADPRSGEDRSCWVMSYEAKTYVLDRVSAGSLRCDNFAIAIFGNIQPRVLRENMSSMASDGLMQRFIPIVLRPHFTKLGEPVPEWMTSAAEWENAIRLLYSLPPMQYQLDGEAYAAFREFQAWYEGAKADERILQSPGAFQTAFGKLEGTAGRIMLLFHMLENPWSQSVSVELVRRVVELVKKYIVPSLRYTFQEVSNRTEFDQWVLETVVQFSDKETISLSDIKKLARRQLEGVSTWDADRKIFAAMYLAESSGWVLRLDDGSQEHLHVAQWAMNPKLSTAFRVHREAVIRAKQRQIDSVIEAVEAKGKQVERRTLVRGYDAATMDPDQPDRGDVPWKGAF